MYRYLYLWIPVFGFVTSGITGGASHLTMAGQKTLSYPYDTGMPVAFGYCKGGFANRSYE